VLRVRLATAPTARTVDALQELARVVRQRAEEMGTINVSPEFRTFLDGRKQA
jgi:hypothetical protein